jgi:hypothetical protein
MRSSDGRLDTGRSRRGGGISSGARQFPRFHSCRRLCARALLPHHQSTCSPAMKSSDPEKKISQIHTHGSDFLPNAKICASTFLPQQVHSQSDKQCEPAVGQPVRVAGVRAGAAFRSRPSSEDRIMNCNMALRTRGASRWVEAFMAFPRVNVAPRQGRFRLLYDFHTHVDKLFNTTHGDMPRRAAERWFQNQLCSATPVKTDRHRPQDLQHIPAHTTLPDPPAHWL